MAHETDKKKLNRKFDLSHLVANSVIAAVAAGTTMSAATGLGWLTFAVAVVGALVAYSATDEIPENGE